MKIYKRQIDKNILHVINENKSKIYNDIHNLKFIFYRRYGTLSMGYSARFLS